MLPDDFKQRLREMTMEIFDSYEFFLVNPFSIENRLDACFIGNTFAINAPIVYGSDLYEFYESEGLGVRKLSEGMGSFIVSQCC